MSYKRIYYFLNCKILMNNNWCSRKIIYLPSVSYKNLVLYENHNLLYLWLEKINFHLNEAEN